MEKRCPWCGELIERPGLSSLGEYRCRCCGKKSTVRQNSLSWWIPAGICFLLMFLLRSVWTVSSLSLIALSVYYSSVIAPLERRPRKFVSVKTAAAKASLIGEWNIIRKRTTFVNGRILVITFVNEDSEAISHTIPVSLDEIKFDEEGLTFRISFIPKNRYFCGFPAGTAFYLFEGKERVAEGVLTEDVKFPRYPAAELPE